MPTQASIFKHPYKSAAILQSHSVFVPLVYYKIVGAHAELEGDVRIYYVPES